ncbi:uncharacterized protein A1O9_08455 [Exophiala aquamarina CBS 119918]|uniref:Uncharacterized protein n=1 Tax=Exophiala aquamarina CBS 119918 TaxID=1182545 RepID=A0A072PJL3_9EURO|nr:uncharacterized protein A1O9_08455 [Exophiala aquamarina CBS 119918]KEF55705.1 hypothetical protein A1O9_08455 [Exophiala aquamarina CBS 119918]
MSERSGMVAADATFAKKQFLRVTILCLVEVLEGLENPEAIPLHKTGSSSRRTSHTSLEGGMRSHGDGDDLDDETERRTHEAISRQVQAAYMTNIKQSSTNSEPYPDYLSEVQQTNEFEEFVFKILEILAWEIHHFPASSVNDSMISPPATVQDMTRGKVKLDREILAGLPWYNSLYAGSELDYEGRRRLKQHLRLPCFVSTAGGRVPGTVLQDTGAEVSVMTKKLAKDFDADVQFLDKVIKLRTANGGLLVTKEIAVIDLRLPCGPEKVWPTMFYIVGNLINCQAYLSIVDFLRMGHFLIAHCKECARARSDL